MADTNLYGDRIATERREGHEGMCPMAAGVKGGQGLLALVDDNGLYDPTDAVKCLGVTAPRPALQHYDNTGGGDRAILMRLYFDGKFPFDMDGADPIAAADVGRPLFAIDNHTVSKQPFDASGNVRPFVGYLATEGVEGDQAWVRVEPYNMPTAEQMREYIQAPSQTLAAATAVVIDSFQKVYPLAAASAIQLTAALPAGVVGQRLQLAGADNTNTVTIAEAGGISNVRLVGGVAAVLGAGDQITLEYDGTNWIEQFRSMTQ